MLIKDIWGDKRKISLYTYKDLVFTVLLFLTDAFFCACYVFVIYNQENTVELRIQLMNSL